MKIAIILPDLRGGGAEKVNLNLAYNWFKKGHEVTFILMRKKGEFLKKIHPKFNIIDLKKKRIRQILFPLAKYFFYKKPDIIIANMWPLTTVATISWLLSFRQGKFYTIDHVHLSTSVKKELFIPKVILKYSLIITYFFVNRIITVSKGVADDIIKINKKFKKKVKVIYNPVVIKKNKYISKKKIELTKKIWGKKKIYKILSIGSLKLQKDFFNLIRAFAKIKKLKKSKLIIVGDGPLRYSLQEYCQKFNLEDRVLFAGFRHNISDYYHTADLFVCSSKWEGFSNVIAEALSYGLPVVATNCKSGPSEILKNGKYGSLVPVNNSIKLSKEIDRNFSLKKNKKILIKRSMDFEIKKISDQYIKLFNENK